MSVSTILITTTRQQALDTVIINRGPSGSIGPSGAQGIQGIQGPIGPTGVQGPTGPTGPTGPQGIQGVQGLSGATGPQGPSGLSGNTILNGSGIPPSGTGVDGDFYYRTSTYDFYGPKTSGAWSSFVNIIGPQGPAGTGEVTGVFNTIFNGSGIPSTGIGSSGDFYLDVSSYDFYGPKTSIWGAGVSLIGPSGATGLQGEIGPTGAQGPIGPTGVQGPTGIQGPSGATGAQGPQGIQGIQGTSGTDGRTILNGLGSPDNGIGLDGDFYLNTGTYDFYGPKSGTWSSYINIIGPTGAQGPTGLQGPTGIQGPIGPTGIQGPTGAQGASGLPGTNGYTILNGTGIPDIGLGVSGDFYLRTSTYDFYGPKSGSWDNYFNLIGPTGAQGPIGPQGATGVQGPTGATGIQGPSGLSGNTILNGTGIPSIGLGQDGDFYYRTSTYDFYGPKQAGGGWLTSINLIGPSGASSSGAAGTKTLAIFNALDNQPPSGNYATFDTRNSIAVLDFDDGATNESAIFVGFIPEAAVLTSGIKTKIAWMATSATSGNCRWGVAFEKCDTDLDSDSFDTATEDHSSTNSTNGIVTVTEITSTNIDSLAAGDLFRLKVYRDSSDTTNDTMIGDAELIAVELQSVI